MVGLALGRLKVGHQQLHQGGAPGEELRQLGHSLHAHDGDQRVARLLEGRGRLRILVPLGQGLQTQGLRCDSKRCCRQGGDALRRWPSRALAEGWQRRPLQDSLIQEADGLCGQTHHKPELARARQAPWGSGCSPCPPMAAAAHAGHAAVSAAMPCQRYLGPLALCRRQLRAPFGVWGHGACHTAPGRWLPASSAAETGGAGISGCGLMRHEAAPALVQQRRWQTGVHARCEVSRARTIMRGVWAARSRDMPSMDPKPEGWPNFGLDAPVAALASASACRDISREDQLSGLLSSNREALALGGITGPCAPLGLSVSGAGPAEEPCQARCVAALAPACRAATCAGGPQAGASHGRDPRCCAC